MNSARVKTTLVLLLFPMLVACGEERTSDIPLQKWRDLEVHVESRTGPPSSDMNEFLVTVTDEHGRPGYDLIVSLRTSDQDAWTQAIEDGQVGVYRRAVKVEQGTRPVLQVQIKRNDTQNTLYFPLRLNR